MDSPNKNKTKPKIDIKTAFLNGDLEEEILMNRPERFDDGSRQTCRLQKSLDGLKQ